MMFGLFVTHSIFAIYIKQSKVYSCAFILKRMKTKEGRRVNGHHIFSPFKGKEVKLGERVEGYPNCIIFEIRIWGFMLT